LRLGTHTLGTLGASAEEIAGIEAQVRKRDAERLELEIVGGRYAGRAFFSGKRSEDEVPSASDEGTDS
jgi:hypothetical protein